jgi:hypothetical protein
MAAARVVKRGLAGASLHSRRTFFRPHRDGSIFFVKWLFPHLPASIQIHSPSHSSLGTEALFVYFSIIGFAASQGLALDLGNPALSVAAAVPSWTKFMSLLQPHRFPRFPLPTLGAFFASVLYFWSASPRKTFAIQEPSLTFQRLT